MRVLLYIVVGGLNTLIGIAFYGLLLHWGAPFPVASGASLILGVVLGFHAHKSLVFRRPGGFSRYIVVWICIYCLANGMIFLLRPKIGDFWAGVATTPASAAASYLALRRWVFSGR